MIFPRRALKRGVGGWGTKGCPLGTFSSYILCRVAKNGHPKHFLTILFRVTKNRHKKIINQSQAIRCSPHQSADKRLTASPLEKPNGRGRHLPSLEKANGGSRELHLNLKQTARRSHVTFGRYGCVFRKAVRGRLQIPDRLTERIFQEAPQL